MRGDRLNSTVAGLATRPLNPMEEFKDGSSGHPGIREFMALGFCCQTPILVLPDDAPAHPYAVAMESVRLAPNAEVSLYPWKDSPDHLEQAVRHVRTFLRAHQPAMA